MGYTIVVLPSAERDLMKLPGGAWDRVRVRIDGLTSNRRSMGAKKLHGSKDRYRIRGGNCRILLRIDDSLKKVIVDAVGHRKDINR